jgi:hypothetical protein
MTLLMAAGSALPYVRVKLFTMEYEFSTPYTITNIVAIVSAIVAMRWPTRARALLSAIFIGAAFVNIYVATTDPQLYVGYGELTTSKLYRTIILGPFSAHPQRYVLMIAICQLLIGIYTCYKGKMMKAAMMGGIIFLLAIAPLGIGSAFPSTLIMATAFVILLMKKIDFNFYELLRQKVKFSKQ